MKPRGPDWDLINSRGGGSRIAKALGLSATRLSLAAIGKSPLSAQQRALVERLPLCDAKANRSAACKAAWADPETRAKMSRPRVAWSPEMIEALVEMRRREVSMRKCSKRIVVCMSVLVRKARELGLTPPPRGERSLMAAE